MQTEELIIDGRRIEYGFVRPGAAHGADGGDIVMLHEGLGSVSMWRDFPERLARATGRRTLVYSRHGYGRSSPIEAPRTVDYMHEEARRLPAILERLKVRRPILFGHSDGASIALIHGAEAASDVAGVVALAPHVKVEDMTVNSITAAKAAYLQTDLPARLSRHHVDADGAFWGWNRIWLDPAFRHWNIEALLPRIRCPILAIQGEDDEYGTLEQVESIARSAPRARVLSLAACRHSPHRDQPAAVLEAVTEFAASIAPPSPVPPNACPLS
jgi:pimeloyl-ACP methyl ester carboxylesterase